MKKEDDTPAWATAAGMGIVICLLASFALVAAGGWTWFATFLMSSASGWVQAIGSIGAIAMSVWLVGRQAHNDRERAREDAAAERFRYLDVALELVGGAALVADKIAVGNFSHSAETFDSMEADFGALVNALAAMDVTRLDGHDQVEAVLTSLGAARRLLADIDNARRSTFDTFITMRGLASQAKEMAEIIGSRAKTLGQAWRAAGGKAPEVRGSAPAHTTSTNESGH